MRRTVKQSVTITAGEDSPHKYNRRNMCHDGALPSCTTLPRQQVCAGICHTGSAQLRSPHYPLWTRTDVISLSVCLSPPFPLSHTCIISRFFSTLLSTCILLYFCAVFPACALSLSHSPSPACALISLLCCCGCSWVTQPGCHTWFGGLG